MNLNEVVDRILYFLHGKTAFEKKLLRYQGYRSDSVPVWRQSTGFSWRLTKKILSRLEVFDGQRIRSLISSVVQENANIFNDPNCFVTSFGSEGKSGSMVIYDFRKANPYSKDAAYKSSWDLASLPSRSKVIFVDDIIATGTQSVDYINKRINLLLNPSFEPYLLSVCATPEGIKNVESNTNFKVLSGMILDESEHFHYRSVCKFFSEEEKTLILKMNECLNNRSRVTRFDLGLLIAFYYSVPNNSMPILWKDKFTYKINEESRTWFALLPREF